MPADGQSHVLNGAARRALDAMERTGKSTLEGVSSFGYGAALFFECIYWVFRGKRRR